MRIVGLPLLLHLLVSACQAPEENRAKMIDVSLRPLALLESLVAREGRRAAFVEAQRRHMLIDRDGYVLVELHGADVDAALWESRGGATRHLVAGFAEAWVPLEALGDLRRALPFGVRMRTPHIPTVTTGPVESEAVALTEIDPVHCAGALGGGVTVSVVDTAFSGFANAREAGEIPSATATPPSDGNAHGTGCSEIVADMAPEAIIDPVRVTTFGDVLALADRITADGIQVVSHSLTWTEFSLGDGTGPMCELIDAITSDGAAFVTSAGNFGAGRFYTAVFEDEDGDLDHDFALGDDLNRFSYGGNTFTRIYLEWDGYPQTDIDYDLYLLRDDGSGYEVLNTSTVTQDGAGGDDPPDEQLIGGLPAGDYALSVRKADASQPDVRFRIFIINGREPNLQYSQSAGSMVDPATCAGAVTVGAIRASDWEPGASVFATSSRGPTTDGRTKPDLVAPSHVSTSSFGTFSGTSAAAPHVAGAVAAYLSGGAPDTATAVQWLLADAAPEGEGSPNDDFGRGRLAFDAVRVGAVCAPGETLSCTTSCGSLGETICTDQCGPGTCTPPPETCNGIDDDCDGDADNGFECMQGSTLACTTECGSVGTQACDAACTLGTCVAPVELCNGVDDDCDDLVDEGCASENNGNTNDDAGSNRNGDSSGDGSAQTPDPSSGAEDSTEARAQGCAQAAMSFCLMLLRRRRAR